jgi:hypothetical protein
MPLVRSVKRICGIPLNRSRNEAQVCCRLSDQDVVVVCRDIFSNISNAYRLTASYGTEQYLSMCAAIGIAATTIYTYTVYGLENRKIRESTSSKYVIDVGNVEVA